MIRFPAMAAFFLFCASAGAATGDMRIEEWRGLKALIEKLGDPDWAVREKATRILAAGPLDRIRFLKEHEMLAPDPEVRFRLRTARNAIEWQLDIASAVRAGRLVEPGRTTIGAGDIVDVNRLRRDLGRDAFGILARLAAATEHASLREEALRVLLRIDDPALADFHLGRLNPGDAQQPEIVFTLLGLAGRSGAALSALAPRHTLDAPLLSLLAQRGLYENDQHIGRLIDEPIRRFTLNETDYLAFVRIAQQVGDTAATPEWVGRNGGVRKNVPLMYFRLAAGMDRAARLCLLSELAGFAHNHGFDFIPCELACLAESGADGVREAIAILDTQGNFERFGAMAEALTGVLPADRFEIYAAEIERRHRDALDLVAKNLDGIKHVLTREGTDVRGYDEVDTMNAAYRSQSAGPLVDERGRLLTREARWALARALVCAGTRRYGDAAKLMQRVVEIEHDSDFASIRQVVCAVRAGTITREQLDGIFRKGDRRFDLTLAELAVADKNELLTDIFGAAAAVFGEREWSLELATIFARSADGRLRKFADERAKKIPSGGYDPFAYLDAGRHAFASGDIERAFFFFDEAYIRGGVNPAHAAAGLAEIHLVADRKYFNPERALWLADKAMQTFPRQAEARVLAARACRAAGRTAEAAECFRFALAGTFENILLAERIREELGDTPADTGDGKAAE